MKLFLQISEEQILNFQNTFVFDRGLRWDCDEIRMEIGDTDRKFLWKHNLNEISVCETEFK
jgi:hypothetical protein